jgi:hypothetical protein
LNNTMDTMSWIDEVPEQARVVAAAAAAAGNWGGVGGSKVGVCTT